VPDRRPCQRCKVGPFPRPCALALPELMIEIEAVALVGGSIVDA